MSEFKEVVFSRDGTVTVPEGKYWRIIDGRTNNLSSGPYTAGTVITSNFSAKVVVSEFDLSGSVESSQAPSNTNERVVVVGSSTSDVAFNEENRVSVTFRCLDGFRGLTLSISPGGAGASILGQFCIEPNAGRQITLTSRGNTYSFNMLEYMNPPELTGSTDEITVSVPITTYGENAPPNAYIGTESTLHLTVREGSDYSFLQFPLSYTYDIPERFFVVEWDGLNTNNVFNVPVSSPRGVFSVYADGGGALEGQLTASKAMAGFLFTLTLPTTPEGVGTLTVTDDPDTPGAPLSDSTGPEFFVSYTGLDIPVKYRFDYVAQNAED